MVDSTEDFLIGSQNAGHPLPLILNIKKNEYRNYILFLMKIMVLHKQYNYINLGLYSYNINF